MQDYDIETLAVRAGIARSQFNEHSEALYLTSSFVFENAAEAADRFCNNAPGNIYSRFTNPTVTAFQERLAALEGAQACVATASGMSAILATAMATLKAGDHVVCSSGYSARPCNCSALSFPSSNRDGVRGRHAAFDVARRDEAEHPSTIP